MNQESKTDHIVIVAGEASGDLHAADLIKAIHKQSPNITFSGLGGPKMEECGVHLYKDLTTIAVMGFVEVLKHYPKFKEAFDLIIEKIEETKAKAVILVDYPGFNLRLAEKLHEKNIKVIYYISPQVWAWKKDRVYKIRKYVDLVLTLFKFEEDFYKEYDVNAKFVGHPTC